MKNIILVLLCFISAVSVAQEKGLPLEGSVQAGLLEGEQGSAFQLGFTGGVKLKTWTASLGTGLDYYSIRSIPLYAGLQKNLFNRTNTPFAYVQGGYHFPWLSKETTNVWDSGMGGEREAKGGAFYGAGIGYQFPALKTGALFFAAGYSFKQFSEVMTIPSFCPGPGPRSCPTYTETYSYRLRRLSITTGLRF